MKNSPLRGERISSKYIKVLLFCQRLGLIFLALYSLAIGNASKKWTMPVRNWSMAMNQFAIIFGDDRVKIA